MIFLLVKLLITSISITSIISITSEVAALGKFALSINTLIKD